MNKEKGSSIIEVLIAIAILTIGISAAAMLSFASQSLEVDTDTSQEALYMAKGILEDARADSRENFYSVNTSVSATEEIYTSQLFVSDDTQCRKTATSTITWNVSPVRPQIIELATILTDIAGTLALGGDCDVEPVSSNWDNPKSYDISDPIHEGSGATDIDVIKRTDGKFAVMTTNKVGTNDTLWIVNVIDEQNPILSGSFGDSDDSSDFNSVDTTADYAFVATASTTGQLQTFGITSPASPSLLALHALPEAPTALGRSIFYLDDKIYLGTQYLACPSCPVSQNNELHIFDVSDPAGPIWQDSINVDRNVNDIVVRGGLAYLATGPGNPGNILRIFDVNPSSPTYKQEVGSFAVLGNEQGTRIYLSGNTIFLGRERTPAARKDFYIIDISDPTNPTELGSENLGLNPNTEVVGVVARGNLVFIVTTDQTPSSGGGPLIIFDISNTATPVPIITCQFNYAEKATNMDFLDNTIFVSNESQNALRIIYPALTCS